MALDFSKLDALRNRGCETAQQLKEREAQHKTREALLNKGFTCIGGNTPFSTPPETVSAPQRATPAAPETIPLSATEPATAPASAPQRAVKPPLKTQETGVNVNELLRKASNYAAEYYNIMDQNPEDQLAMDEAFTKLIAEYVYSPTMREDVKEKVIKVIEAVEILLDTELGERLAKRLEASGK